MSATCASQPSCKACSNISRSAVLPSPAHLAASRLQLPARPHRAGRIPTTASGMAAAAAFLPAPLAAISGGFGAGSSSSGLGSSSTIASIVGCSLAFLFYLRSMQVEQTDSNLPECPRCEGTGFTECVCTRWSDGDVGCASCRGTGKAVCPSCGGGGHATPIRQEVHVHRD